MKRSDFKKPLRVKFIGEEGVDEGGVRKEFFQLLIKELVGTQYGMFTINNETHTFWFNPFSLENSNNIQLIGTVSFLSFNT
jgi:ubiquitin-protein ligase E3 A